MLSAVLDYYAKIKDPYIAAKGMCSSHSRKDRNPTSESQSDPEQGVQGQGKALHGMRSRHLRLARAAGRQHGRQVQGNPQGHRDAHRPAHPSMGVADAGSEGTAVMYWNQKRPIQKVNLKCLPDYSGAIVYE